MGLGATIGVIVDNFTITNDDQDKVQLSVKWDFRTATDADIKSWLCGNRRIAFQRPSRAMNKAELESCDKSTIPAIDAGKKVKTRQQRINELMAIGLTEPFAIMAIDEPDKFQTAQRIAEKMQDDELNK